MGVPSKRDVLVIGATGNQGGAVAEHLLADRDTFDVYALTRDGSQPAAEGLRAAGARVIEGDLADRDALADIMAGFEGVFCVVNFWVHGYDRQVELATNAARAAEKAGVEHFVFSSVCDADADTGIPHFASCAEIEEAIEDLGLPATVVAPTWFHQNLEPMRQEILSGTLALPLPEGVGLQMVDVADVGRVTAQVLSDPDRWIGERIDLAAGEATLSEMAATLTDVTGTEVQPVPLSTNEAPEAFRDGFARWFEWIDEVGYRADVDAVREAFGPLVGLEEYLRDRRWAKGSPEPRAEPGWTKG